ncbi:helix-turn-helix domain-containing protein [Vibrio sp. LaRot3]|uniref:helix-turn-helix domain-containing protein n=1 Tax=Vibrio sp. LaRot3 TaxID=2998829 RepID=UPI0022CDBF2B|nr:AraC family transcriptional regulator [Vibrio sp. LaRot3]MDA0149871.1 AraC family transcriptional regulator [Vibrio sp. LaRot3]
MSAVEELGRVYDQNSNHNEMSNFIELQSGLTVGLFSRADMEQMDIESPLPSNKDYIHLNHFIQGHFSATVKGKNLNCDSGYINMGFSDGEMFHVQDSDDFCNLEIMVRPEVLYSLAGEELTGINFDKDMEFFIRQGRSSQQVNSSVSRVITLMKQQIKHPLLLHSAILEYLYWHLQALKPANTKEFLSTREKRQLAVAKDCLLSDLSSAPTIAELAKTVGVNQCKLKKGFKELFGTSVYACFQEERMKRAMELLKHHNVTETAVALGYSNISHFSTAFRKQYGVLPNNARRELMYDFKFNQHELGVNT